MSLNEFITHRLSVRAYHKQKSNLWLPITSVYKRDTEGCAVPPLDIRVQAFSFNHIVQALQNRNMHVFCYFPLSEHALVPSPFRV